VSIKTSIHYKAGKTHTIMLTLLESQLTTAQQALADAKWSGQRCLDHSPHPCQELCILMYGWHEGLLQQARLLVPAPLHLPCLLEPRLIRTLLN